MVRYTGPRIRIIRRLGLLPGLTRKNSKNRTKTPGQHGKLVFTKTKRSSLSDDYRERLLEKQKLRFNYGITEKQLISYYKEAKRRSGSTGTLLLELLEARLDCVIYRLGFASTIPAARQLINHGHILVNNKLVNIPSFICKAGDNLSIREKENSKKLIENNFEIQQQKRKLIQRRMKRVNLTKSRFHSLLPTHLEIDNEKLIGKFLSPVKRKDVLLRINELKVVEYYSR
jgi:small subunit ribosomal protein S4